ncbi:MAG: hypothetical protein AABY51_10015 [Deltaproteobacteria bacterium]
MPAAVAVAAIVSTVVSVASAYMQYQAAESAEDAAHNAEVERRQQAEYQKQMAAENAKAIEEQAQAEAEQIRLAGDRTKKTQRALAAKAGMNINEGTALDLQNETDLLVQKDVGTVLGNAKKKSNMMLMQGTSDAMQINADASAIGEQGKQNLNAATAQSLFTVANTAASGYKDYNKTQNLLDVNKAQVANESNYRQMGRTNTERSDAYYGEGAYSSGKW